MLELQTTLLFTLDSKKQYYMTFIKQFSIILIASIICINTFAQEKIACHVEEYVNTVNPHASARKTRTGVILVGSVDTVRAFNGFGTTKANAIAYAECANLYKRTFGDTVNIYLTAIPTAVAFYCPDEAKKWTNSQADALNIMFEALDPGVIPVDVYTILGQHAHEPIYSRTDHHWAPLGAYYAAMAFAEAAYVPFKDLSHYEEVVIPNYVGTMHMYSKDNSVKNSPEDFVYYKPMDIDYTTTYITYSLGNNRKSITRESAPRQGDFFLSFKGVSSYCTFMGGDSKITQVRTATDNGRRLIIIKDSFGNAIPGYLFYSFEEIHVIDYRYFNKNLKEYVSQHGITDILLANNISFACNVKAPNAYKRFLEQ